jgi:hypothetical protein
MALANQVHGAGDVEPSRRRRSGAVRAPVALNDNRPAGQICPACGAWAPIAPIASDYLGGGQIHHHWMCEPCGHAWTTAVRILS